jgi:hypothetical protein
MIADKDTYNAQGLQRPKWSLKTAFWVFVSIVLLSSVAVPLLSHRPLWVELEMVVAIVALVIFLFYWWVLYRGVHFCDDEHLTVTFVAYEATDPMWPNGGFGFASGADDPIGCIIALLLEVLFFFLFAFVFSFLIWLGINGLVLSIAIIATPIFYVFRSSIRFVLRVAPVCRQNLLKSGVFAGGFALLKTCWLFAVIAGSHYLALWYRAG